MITSISSLRASNTKRNEVRTNTRWIVPYLLLAIIAIIFVFIASFSTSPLYPYYYGGDSAQFQTIGKGWANGMIPYRDFFDHKGPVIFFIDMLGYAISGTSAGIFVIQVFFMFITAAAVFRTAKLAIDKNTYGIVAVTMFLLALTLVYSDGNLTEEYCLPFISISTYFQLKYLYSESKTTDKMHNCRFAAVYGVSFGVCFLTRITNGVTICSGILVISVILVLNKQYVNLCQNALCFIGGFLMMTLPFVVYFSCYGVASDLFYAMLKYNFEYQSHMPSWLVGSSWDSWKTFGILYFTSYSIFGAAFLALWRQKYALAIYFAICGFLECYMFLSGALFTQYAIITMPQFILLLNEIKLLKENSAVGKLLKKLLLYAMAAFCCLALAKFIKASIRMYNSYKSKPEVGYETLLKNIPEYEKDSFVAYGGNDLKTLYLLNDLLPCYKYFVIQEWHSSFSEYVKTDIYDIFKNGNALWILTDQYTDNINDILEKRYQMIDDTEKYRLYRKCKTN